MTRANTYGGADTEMNVTDTRFRLGATWRYALLTLCVFGPLVVLVVLPPMPQPQQYYHFADRRVFFGIPNFFDVTTNLAFLVVGLAGLRYVAGRDGREMSPAWLVFVLGLVSLGAGSAYFHWHPGDDTLVWDRASLTMGFTGLSVALFGERVNVRLGRWLLLPVVGAGIASVFYWHRYDDLRFYAWVQFMPLLAIPVLLLLFPSPHGDSRFIVAALVCYVAAKLAEVYDRELFAANGHLFSGHSMKHLLAGTGCLFIVLMLRRRRLALSS